MGKDPVSMTPQELAIWRAERALEQEKTYQTRAQRQGEARRAWLAHRIEIRGRTRKVLDAILERLSLTYMRERPEGPEAVEAVFEAELDAREARNRAILTRIEGPLESGCGHFTEIPVPWIRIRELVASAAHPQDLEPFEINGKAVCGGRHGPHDGIMIFEGLNLEDVGVEPCCPHRYRVVKPGPVVSLAERRFQPGEPVDVPEDLPGVKEQLEPYLRARYVVETEKGSEELERRELAPQEILQAAVSARRRD